MARTNNHSFTSSPSTTLTSEIRCHLQPSLLSLFSLCPMVSHHPLFFSHSKTILINLLRLFSSSHRRYNSTEISSPKIVDYVSMQKDYKLLENDLGSLVELYGFIALWEEMRVCRKTSNIFFSCQVHSIQALRLLP